MIIGRGPVGQWLGADEEPDGAGLHRIYSISEDGRSAEPVFSSIEELLEWVSTPNPGPLAAALDAARPASSVEVCLSLMWQLHPAIFFLSYKRNEWPDALIESPRFDAEEPGWRRTALLWTLAAFHAHEEVALPPDTPEEELGLVYEELIRFLHDLAEAMDTGEVPTFIGELSLSDDEELSTAAIDWMIHFDRNREQPDEDEDAPAARTRELMAVLRLALQELIGPGHIEIIEDREERLVEDLLEVVLKQARVEMIIPSLIEALIDSKHVEEVYADDAMLEGLLSKALGVSGR